MVGVCCCGGCLLVVLLFCCRLFVACLGIVVQEDGDGIVALGRQLDVIAIQLDNTKAGTCLPSRRGLQVQHVSAVFFSLTS